MVRVQVRPYCKMMLKSFKKSKLSPIYSIIRDRKIEHLNNDNSSVKKHISKYQNKVHKGIEIKTIILENDPANLRLFEAFYIRNYKPALNSREECSESADLLF